MYFEKNLNFHKEFVYQVGGRLVDLVVAVVLALTFRSVWALVAGIVAMNFVKFILSYAIHEYRPNIEFNLAYGKEMFGFGKWLLVSAILLSSTDRETMRSLAGSLRRVRLVSTNWHIGSQTLLQLRSHTLFHA
nr:oligosaccharide flippase family protein [Natrinema sp. CBA1119]